MEMGWLLGKRKPIDQAVNDLVIWFSLILLLLWLSSAVTPYTWGEYWDYRLSSIMIIVLGILTWIAAGKLVSVQVIGFAALFYPAMGPFAAYLVLGEPVYSGWNIVLQQDAKLTNKIMHLFLSGAACYLLGVLIGRRPVKSERIDQYGERLSLGASLVLASVFLVSCYLMEPESSIFSTRYSQMRPEGIGSIGAFASQLMILTWALLFAGARHHKKIFYIVTLVGFVYLILHGRRSETLGMMLVYLVYNRVYISNKILVILIMSGMLLFMAIEHVRDTSFVNFSYSRLQQNLEGKFRLPGASNIMITVYDIVELKDEDHLHKNDLFTFDSWFVRLLPTPLVTAAGIDEAYLEGHVINMSHLDYKGGMHSIGIMYLNGGIGLVLLWALLMGIISPSVDHSISRGNLLNYKGLISLIFLIVLFRFHWYHPIGFMKQLLYVGIVYIFLITLKKKNYSARL